MEGMNMEMTTATEMATTLATVLATAASATSTVPAALQTDAVLHDQENSSPMEMQGMASSIHFGVGDTFLAAFLTPTQASGYVAVMLLLTMLSFSQRLLMAVESKAAQKLHQQAQTADHEQQPSKSGWFEVENAQSSGGAKSTFFSRALIKSALQVSNAALGFLV
ncbi:hypothetical protein HRR83_004077 [Exophiala dermatitidis]|nr:hypothetical protein HRR73_007720 [Exophiala dermatitidis]KAJ4531804.1 hypothetical protein HRR77_009213 [Exophiala dermatitidis]KAJ4537368.1 hypothetical protein HRR76_005378 [Exophiala dermatitidis]KAJ4597933.1 hypothetical protein HRR83_004077 [Exophiala dermatitidis]KAJ4600589.1 hypothetical protein HRR85_009296 [Exophiala dermatitidis]